MKLSELLNAYTTNMSLKAQLLKSIKLEDGKTMKKGTISDLLIDKGNGTYHFEAKNNACTVIAEEIQMINKSLNKKPKIK